MQAASAAVHPAPEIRFFIEYIYTYMSIYISMNIHADICK